MQSIRRRLSIILIFCTVTAVLLSALLVNITITNTFKNYMEDIQGKRDVRLVDYFEQIYRRDQNWSSTSGQEMKHEAYMSNYCLTLLDQNKKVVWQMDPNDIEYRSHILLNGREEEGVFNTNSFEIKVDEKIVGYLLIGQYSPILLSKEDISFKSEINKSIVFTGVLTIAIVAIIALIISKQFSNPIKEVSKTSVNLSKGLYESRSSTQSSIKEIKDLIISINFLGNKLKSQDLLRKRLVSDISHEIRTPLNILQNNLEAMIDGFVPVTNEKLNNLNDEVIRFGKLLNNLNVLKEIESEEAGLNIGKVNIEELFSVVSSDFLVAASEKNIQLVVNKYTQEDLIILGDYDKLKQVFINLVSNAIKFSNDNGMVCIDLYADKDYVIVKIKDNGIGIKKEDLPYIFERMYRGDKSRHKIEGSGIGLTIVKKILDLHSATIDVESTENKETTFIVQLDKRIKSRD
jgi:signal transduction histidine kinase